MNTGIFENRKLLRAQAIVLVGMLIAAGSIAVAPAVLAADDRGNLPDLSEPHGILGYLYDDTGPAIPGVTVTVQNARTGETFTDVTNPLGAYDVDIAGALEYLAFDTIYIYTEEPNQAFTELTVDTAFPYQWANLTVDRTDPVIGTASVDKTYINNDPLNTFGGVVPPVAVTVSDVTDNTALGAAAWAIRGEFDWEGTMYFSCDITGEPMPCTYDWNGEMYQMGGVLVTVSISPMMAGTDLFVFGEVNGASAPGDEIGNTMPTHYATFLSDGTYQAVYSTEGTFTLADDNEVVPAGGDTFRAYRYDEGAGYIATAAISAFTVAPWVSLAALPVPDGRYAVCVSAMDEAGNAAWTNETTPNPVITVDNFAPSATSTGPDTSNVHTFDVEYGFAADPLPSSGILNVTLFYNRESAGWMTYGTDPTPMDGAFPVDVATLGGDGTYEWCLIAFDNTENREDAVVATEWTTLVDTAAPTIGATLADFLFINNDPLNTFGGTMPPVTVSAEVWDDNIAAAGWGIRDEFQWEGTMYFTLDITDDVEDNAMPAEYTWDGNMYLIDGAVVTASMSPYAYGTDLFVFGEVNGASAPGDEIGNTLPTHYATFLSDGTYQSVYSTEGTPDRADDIEVIPAGGETFRPYRYDEGSGYIATAALETFTVDPWVTLTITPVPDGRYAICVTAVDWAQNAAWTNETTPNPVITVDNFAPSATATGPDTSNVHTFDVDYGFAADPLPSSGILNVTLFYNRESAGWMTYGTDPTPMDGAFPVDVATLGGDGTYEWCLIAFDNTENREDAVVATEWTTLVDTAAPTIGATLVDKLYISNQGTFGGIAPPVMISAEVWDDNLAAGGWGIRDEFQWEGTIYFTCDITTEAMPAIYGWDGSWYHIDGVLVTAGISPANGGTDLFVFGEVNGASAPGDEIGNSLPTHYATFLADGTNPSVYSTEGTLDYSDDVEIVPVGGETFRAYRYDEGTGYVATAALSTFTVDPWMTLDIAPVPDGRYAVCVSAIDWAQNSAWTNETTPNPVITVDNFPAYANATGPAASMAFVFDVTYTFVTDPLPSSGMLNVSLWYNLNGTGWIWFAEDPTPGDGLFPVDLSALGDGTYEWIMAAFDMAENHEDLLFAAEATTIVDTTSPFVVITTPADGTVDVPLAAGTYVIEFSEPMDTVSGAVTDDLPGVTWTWSANGMWLNGTYTDLTESTTYNIDLSAGGFQDVLGNALIAGIYGWTFTFSTVGIPPEVVTTVPLDAAVDVSLAAGTYAIQFNEPMDIGSGTVTTDLIGAAWTWSSDAMWLNGTYTGLTESTTYNIDLSAGGFTDVYGNALVSGSYGWTFTFTTVGIAPTIESTSPFGGETGVALAQNVVVTFSEAIDTATVTYTCTPDPAGWTEIWSAGDTVLTLTHNDFGEFTTYTFEVTYAEDLFGNALAAGVAPNPWTFETVGTFDLAYSAGWNLFGIPVLNPEAGGMPLVSAYNLTQLGASMVSKWNFLTQRYTNFIAGFHLPGDAQNFALLPDEAYWAWMPAGGSLAITGQNPGVRSLAVDGPGWNMVAYMDPLNVGDVGTDWATQVSCGAFDDIAYYDGGAFYHYIFPSDVMALEPGRGYFVWSDIPTNINYNAAAWNSNTGVGYQTIQAAINAAGPYDTISVEPGTYYEELVITQPLTLQGSGSGIALAMSGNTVSRTTPTATTTIVADSGPQLMGGNLWEGSAIAVLSDDVEISGFEVTGSNNAGVYLYYADFCTVSDVKASDNIYGFFLESSADNTLSYNEAVQNSNSGFELWLSDRNEISDSRMQYNYYGLSADTCTGMLIDGNEALANFQEAFKFSYCGDIYLDGNTVDACPYGVSVQSSTNVQITSNVFTETMAGTFNNAIILWEVTVGMIAGNQISNHQDYAIGLASGCTGVTITQNHISNGFGGIYLEAALGGIQIFDNDFLAQTGYSVYVILSDAMIHHNNFIMPMGPWSFAYSECPLAIWDDGMGTGNFWDGWMGGPYPMDGPAMQFDFYPSPFPFP